MRRPRARIDGLAHKRIDDEVVVVDTHRQRAHCLNRAAALLWQRCDGRTEIAQLASALAEELSIEDPEPIVEFGLGQLTRARLLDEGGGPTAPISSRRQLLKRLGTAALVPLVVSIVLPTPAMAQSMLPNGAPCSASSQCASGCCHATQLTCKPGAGNCL